MRNNQKLGQPLFIAAVLLLVLNDWVLKSDYSNWFTGKLSDFAGLFAFPFFLSAFFPTAEKRLYGITLVLFIAWKSPIVQPVIDGLNGIGLPTHRTIDYSDLIALAVLPFSYHVFQNSKVYMQKPVLLNIWIIFSALVFMATSMPKGKMETFYFTDKTYDYNFSKKELVARINTLQLNYVYEINTYGNGKADFDSKSNIFYFGVKRDTIAVLLDYEKLKATDTILLRTSFAQISISGNENSSQLKLISVKNFVRAHSRADFRANSLNFFERNIVKKIKSYR